MTRTAPREGYAAGLLIGGTDYLTIPGSAYYRVTLHPTAEAAQAELATWHPTQRPNGVVRKVREVYHPGVTVTSTAYRVIEEPEAEAAAYPEPQSIAHNANARTGVYLGELRDV